MSYPTTPKFNAVNIESDSPTLFSETVSGRMQSRKIGGQKWRFSASYASLKRSEFQPVWAFCVAQQGRHGVFSVVPPVISSTSGTASGSVTCSAAAIGDTSVTISGLTGGLKAGDFVKFAGHTKVYMLTADRSGNGAVSIEPALISTVSASEQLVYNDVPFTVRLANDVQTYDTGVGGIYEYEIDFVEAL